MIQHVRVAFEGDDRILELYDPSVKVETIDDVVNDIHRKLLEYDDLFDCTFVGLDDGYFMYTGNLLISFGLNVKSRTEERLSEFWRMIEEQLGGEFTCFLWTKNTRGIRWLEKNGMTVQDTIDYEGHSITRLCH